ncbi:MAG: acyltransferase [Patescibacteria group bacterium]|nr:acyltransferase [Patescibacteria group bacterium]
MSISVINKDRLTTNSAKGFAILAVIIIHLLTIATQQQFSTFPQNLVLISIDQVMRFCVPVFIFISGFGLSLSYQKKEFGTKSFIKKRSLKTLPLYFLWSAYYIVLSIFIKPWWNVLNSSSVFQLILNGRADYHLYFVPIILKLYLIFILLKKLPQKLFKPLLALAILTQLAFYSYFTIKLSLVSDQIQYANILTWLGYFMLGMWLASKKKFLSKKTSIFLIILGLLLSIFEAMQVANINNDTIQAMRFTKLPIFIYSIGIIGFFLTTSSKLIKNKYITWLGINSYLIYLAHPLIIHLFKFDLSLVPVTPTILSFIVLIFLSIFIQKKC